MQRRVGAIAVAPESNKDMMNMLDRLSTAALVVTLSLGACAETEPPGAASSATATAAASASDRAPALVAGDARFDAAGRFVVNDRILPAFRRNPTLPAAKADQYDDVRTAAPQLYAITEAPKRIATVRPMVEWEPMRAIVMSFPSYMFDTTNGTNTFVNIAKHSSEVGEVWFIVDGSSAENGLKQRILNAGVTQATLDAKIKFYRTDMDSVWFIDSGPMPIIDTATNTFAFTDWRYYHERPLDDGVPTDLARNMDAFGYEQTATVYRLPLNMEGGTFQATTDGVCFTSDRQIYNLSCYDDNCNDQLNDMDLTAIQTHPYTLQMEQIVADYLGCKDLVITHSVSDDGTGHIDMYLKVLDDNRILMGDYEAPYDNNNQQINAARLDANAAFLEAYVKPDGSGFTVPRIVMPGHRTAQYYGAIPFTFINSTFFNGINLWPYSDYSAWNGRKAAAQATWDEVLPDYENIPVEATDLSFYSGAIHCVTRTIPAVEATNWVDDGSCSGDSCSAPEDGYTGACSPAGISEQVCWGPEWLCDCNDCDNGCAPTPTGCGEITYWGCCDSGTLYYCDQNEVYYQPCGGSCGWDNANDWYDCGKSGEDPSGEHPIACEPECAPDCDGKSCGGDGCGGSCGTCGAGSTCVSGTCESTCADPICTAGDTGCDGSAAWACIAGSPCPTCSEIDCAVTGKVCEAGQCVAAPVEPEPDTVSSPDTSPSQDTAGVDTAGPGTDTGGTGLDVPGDSDLQNIPHHKKDDGCAAGGGSSTAAGLVLALAGLALLFRRRRHGVR